MGLLRRLLEPAKKVAKESILLNFKPRLNSYYWKVNAEKGVIKSSILKIELLFAESKRSPEVTIQSLTDTGRGVSVRGH